MNEDADDPYRIPPEEELEHLGEYWWHSWLIHPIERGDLLAIQRYLARKPERLHAECPSYYDAFYIAAQQPTPGALRLLLEHWAVHPTPDALPPNERGFLLFNVACEHGALETARYLLDEQPAFADLDARDVYGRTPILAAAASLVSCAMDERHGKLNARAAHERAQRSEALVGLLLDRGACARDRTGCMGWDEGPAVVDSDNDSDTVLSLAIVRAGPALLQRLIDEGADAFAITSDRSQHTFGHLFESTGTSSRLTLLHLAAFYGNYPGVQVLMKHYAQRGLDMADAVARQDEFGRLPIHYAAAGWPGALGTARHRPEPDSIDTDTMALLRILTDSGAPHLINAQDQYGETPLHYAISSNLITNRAAIAVARFLCKDLHASGRLRGRGGETPLHRLWNDRPHNGWCGPHGRIRDASSSIDTSLAALLLDLDEDRAPDVNDVDDDGNAPLHLAARCLAHVPAAGFLLGRGADVRKRNKKGRTPLHEAAGGQFGSTTISAEEWIRAQDAMLAVLCGSGDEALALEKNWHALIDEEDMDGKTPRQIAEATRAAWREEEAERLRPWDETERLMRARQLLKEKH